MGEFTGGGFPEYPNLHLDRESVTWITEWSDTHLNDKIAQYREFTRRLRILPRHMERALDTQRHLEFEGDCRDGIYSFISELENPDFKKLEDEACDRTGE